MKNYADKLIEEINKKGNPCIVGLDPRLDMMPDFVISNSNKIDYENKIRSSITKFHKIILDIVAPLVPAVKMQIAFYEQYGIPGLYAFRDTIRIAKKKGLIVIADAKRNDIASTASAYANAYLGKTRVFGKSLNVYDFDCMTITPFLGRDSVEPFVNVCNDYGKGLFILVKTSNPGSIDLQDQKLMSTKEPLYNVLAEMVNDFGSKLIGETGYSSIGAVVGATFPEEAERLRKMMPKAIFLVPGYGAQGGTADDTIPCFNGDGLGAVINASRSITYAHESNDITEKKFSKTVLDNLNKMIEDVTSSLKKRFGKNW